MKEQIVGRRDEQKENTDKMQVLGKQGMMGECGKKGRNVGRVTNEK